MTKTNLLALIDATQKSMPFPYTQRQIAEEIGKNTNLTPYASNISNALRGEKGFEYLLEHIATVVLFRKVVCQKKKEWRFTE